MKFALLDPRPTPEAAETNEKIFASGRAYGIEVTVPALAARCVSNCVKNLDDQHWGTNMGMTVIDIIYVSFKNMYEDEKEGFQLINNGKDFDDAILVTTHADLDSIGAMALIDIGYQQAKHMMKQGRDLLDRVILISEAHKIAYAGWHPKPLPTSDNPWREGEGDLAAMAAAIADSTVPLDERVATMKHWLLTGEDLMRYRFQVEKDRYGLIKALETGATKYETRCDGRIAVVESTHRSAITVGYSLAPVVITVGLAFELNGGESHQKFTICAFEAGFVNIKAAIAELTTLEEGWSGSPAIGGSPRGVNSTLTIDQVVEVVERHLFAAEVAA